MLRLKIHLSVSAIGAVLGYLAAIVFIYFGNFQAGLWALLSGLHATVCLMLHYHYWKKRSNPPSKKALQYSADYGMVWFVSAVGLTLFYLFLQIYYQADVMPIDSSLTIRLVWSFMLLKWSLMLYLYSKKYMRIYSDHELLSENPNIEETENLIQRGEVAADHDDGGTTWTD